MAAIRMNAYGACLETCPTGSIEEGEKYGERYAPTAWPASIAADRAIVRRVIRSRGIETQVQMLTHSGGTDAAELPRHVAIIMDGNGRWARQRGLPRVEGHRVGIRAVRAVVECARELGIPYLTLYAFSVENWGRPENEVSTLMSLLREFLLKELPELVRHRIRLNVIGEAEKLPSFVREVLDRTLAVTAGHTDMTLTLALSYAGRNEILRAARKLAEDAAKGRIAQADPENEIAAPPAGMRSASSSIAPDATSCLRCYGSCDARPFRQDGVSSGV